jgi:hypothetical protein
LRQIHSPPPEPVMTIVTTRLGEYPAEPGAVRTHQFEVIGCSSYIERSGIGFIQNGFEGQPLPLSWAASSWHSLCRDSHSEKPQALNT